MHANCLEHGFAYNEKAQYVLDILMIMMMIIFIPMPLIFFKGINRILQSKIIFVKTFYYIKFQTHRKLEWDNATPIDLSMIHL